MAAGGRSKTYSCDHCDFSCASKSAAYALRKHLREAHSVGEVFLCDECPFTTWNRNWLEKHRQGGGGGRHVECGRCKFVTASQWALSCHVRSEHGQEERVCQSVNTTSCSNRTSSKCRTDMN